ncbi:UDP-N-acetylmuramate dehydrogenase [Ruminococcus sp.]|uniref:UDP-N-acetylmuramate dehydrogenase n=1 Tax=Ruminococcus sp. TaxID=41978 RepID=UPI0025D2AC74|nr:UDP-N-acetylmuramate dehydrogenase [Ruminococcus sp.]MCI5815685.1 UDP-N-acetylmuramate dehydrogenase [Ruminococcus sp.]MDD7556391.1 UDP-N-acetylmuramate dehydrogenase [Ruminococcus sp.]MDY4963805.1 UDP-N-acetylmuramate dehydrogenase [Ruminococcus callidus]
MTYINQLEALCRQSGCTMETEVSLAGYTTFRVGGPCRVLVHVNSGRTVQVLVQFLRREGIRFAVLGRGSNVIVPDEGFDGVVLLFGSAFGQVIRQENRLICQAGASLRAVCSAALEAELTGLEFAYGIPGTVGGGLYMNAGAYGGELSDVVVSAEYLDREGNLLQMDAEQMELSYRHSCFMHNGGIITGVTFQLQPGDPEQIRTEMEQTLEKRKAKQPLEYPSAGSTFKRPQGDYASRLIEVCGLKGLSVGGAEVSRKHSGFIINKGGATCADILALADRVQQTVREQTGFQLELEPVVLK